MRAAVKWGRRLRNVFCPAKCRGRSVLVLQMAALVELAGWQRAVAGIPVGVIGEVRAGR